MTPLGPPARGEPETRVAARSMHGHTPPTPGAGASGLARQGQPQDMSVRNAGRFAVLVLSQIAVRHLAWGAARFAQPRAALRERTGARFAKVLGSGHEGGFGLRPSLRRQALFLGFDTLPQAQGFLLDSPLVAAYRAHSSECCTVLLAPYSSRGSWDGSALQVQGMAPRAGEPVAALTRASIRLARLAAFWRHAAPSQAALQQAQGCRLAVGLGEAPLLRQATFSLWDDTASMLAYAHGSAHRHAIAAARDGGHFDESMFVRFRALDLQGCWKGRRHA